MIAAAAIAHNVATIAILAHIGKARNIFRLAKKFFK